MVTDSMADNGSLRWATSLSRQWSATGSAVTIYSLLNRRGIPLASPPKGVLRVFGGGESERFRRALPRSVRGLIRAAANAQIIVVTGEVGLSVPLAYLVARARGLPFVIMVQSILDYSLEAWVPRWRRGVWRHCIRHADAVTAVSPGSADSVLRLGVPSDLVTILPPGREVDEVRRQGLAGGAKYVTGASPIVVAVGELAPAKGYDLLLRAVAKVRRRGHDLRLVILGEGGERAALERLATDLDISDAVQLPGFVADPYPEMVAADLFCLSSRVEGFSLCLLEALALNVPTVATDAIGGGPRALLDAGKLGDLIAADSVEALESAILRHLQHPELLRRRAVGGPDRARLFAPSASAAAYKELFCQLTTRSLVNRPRGRSAGWVRRW